ncbi:DNA polymerase III subunit gamma/tau [Cryomorpha ignava]|uniref:DNA polymerase III subunit gamma/tau n=2 Tax=Cryomorpha ignava TaxID=101383 RepID=A0A7K3WVP6_9FLAO|nr:DNA polymerase III subunit gamma/tau [Cryomorpha ignava]
MDDFIVSARKYRPQVFDTVVGQESITQTLLKAIENNHLAQAFLFCGPRGVGKTTCARILARTVNAHSMGTEDEDTDYSFNIFELDAASNNSVDDIRSLIDQVRIPPQIGKYKVYIIDEVHMLSAQAFNAFLKTLEEPPPYAIFIMATTEKHKVLPTILSRCQVFDFNRIQIPDIVNHLSKICEKEGIVAEPDALHIIAEKADGALRDALSIFDQVVSFSGNKLTYQDVIANLNILDYDYYFAVTDAFLKDQKAEVLVTFNAILNKGFDGHNFINGLANHFRNLLFCTSDRTAGIMEVGDTIKERYLEQSKRCDSRFLLNALNTLSETDIHYKSSKNPRLLVELNLLKLCSLSARISEKKKPENDLAFTDDVNFGGEAPKVKPRTDDNKSPTSFPSLAELMADKLTVVETLTNEPRTSYLQGAEPANEKNASAINMPDEPDAASPTDKEEKPTEKLVEAPANASDATPKTPITEIQTDRDTAEKPEAKKSFSSKLSNAKSKGLPSLASMANATKSTVLSQTDSSDTSEKAEAVLYDDRPATDFNLAQLWKAWDEYAVMIKEEDKQSYYSTLSKHKPVMREKFQIDFLVDNHVQKSDLDNDKVRILEFLRERLNNWKIKLESIIDDEEGDDGDSLYDPYKKYEAMIDKNPTLAKMKQLFDLDVDYDG